MTETFDPVRIGIVSISDRASSGIYEDKGLPALREWLTRALKNPITFEERPFVVMIDRAFVDLGSISLPRSKR